MVDILLHDPPECILCSTRHCIRLVQDNQLEPSQPILLPGYGAEDLLRRCERLDLFSYNLDASVVGCVQFEDLLSDVVSAVDVTCEGENCRCLSGPRRAVEEEVGKSLGVLVWRL